MYKEIKANLWEFENSVKVITTNGNLNKNGENIMGKGTALQAKQKYPSLPFMHGENIRLYGNEVFYYPIYDIICFPTKHNWWENSNLDLIKTSMKHLYYICMENCIWKVIIPKVGCSNGGLRWECVKEKILDILEYPNIEFVVVDL